MLDKRYLIVVAVLAAVILSVVHSQDLGFPEETGLPKDKQNANVSCSEYYLSAIRNILPILSKCYRYDPETATTGSFGSGPEIILLYRNSRDCSLISVAFNLFAKQNSNFHLFSMRPHRTESPYTFRIGVTRTSTSIPATRKTTGSAIVDQVRAIKVNVRDPDSLTEISLTTGQATSTIQTATSVISSTRAAPARPESI